MTLAELGEKLGRVLINPKTKLGAVLAVGVGLGLGVGNTDWEKPAQPGSEALEQCQAHPLRNVYRPWRFHILEKCKQLTVTVVEATKERDGDWHVGAIPDEDGLVNAISRKRQHGLLVVEFVPDDPTPAAGFRTGQRLSLLGTLVEDLQHGPTVPGCHRVDWPECGDKPDKRGWVEAHPIFDVVEIQDKGVGPVQPAPKIERRE